MPTKQTPAVAAAKAILIAKQAELTVAEDVVRRVEGEIREAFAAVQTAQEVADASLPQCRLVRVRHHGSGSDYEAGRVVILRKTPGGMIVARRVGDADGDELRFKWTKYGRAYRQAGKYTGFGDWAELRDVPPEHLPQEAKERGHAD